METCRHCGCIIMKNTRVQRNNYSSWSQLPKMKMTVDEGLKQMNYNYTDPSVFSVCPPCAWIISKCVRSRGYFIDNLNALNEKANCKSQQNVGVLITHKLNTACSGPEGLRELELGEGQVPSSYSVIVKTPLVKSASEIEVMKRKTVDCICHTILNPLRKQADRNHGTPVKAMSCNTELKNQHAMGLKRHAQTPVNTSKKVQFGSTPTPEANKFRKASAPGIDMVIKKEETKHVKTAVRAKKVKKRCTFKEHAAILIKQGKYGTAMRLLLKKSNVAHREFCQVVMDEVRRDVMTLMKNGELVKEKFTLKTVENFSWHHTLTEIETLAPVFSASLTGAVVNRKNMSHVYHDSKKKNTGKKVPGLVSVAMQLLYLRSPSLFKFLQSLNSIMLYKNGNSQELERAFNQLGISLGKTGTRATVARVTAEYDQNLTVWMSNIQGLYKAECDNDASTEGFSDDDAASVADLNELDPSKCFTSEHDETPPVHLDTSLHDLDQDTSFTSEVVTKSEQSSRRKLQLHDPELVDTNATSESNSAASLATKHRPEKQEKEKSVTDGTASKLAETSVVIIDMCRK